MQLRRRLGALLAVFAVIGSSALVAAPGAVAVTPPVLDTVSVSATQVTTPGTVTLSYTAHADAPITQVLAGYTDEGGRAYSVTLTSGTSGSGVLKLPDGVRNGLWQLQYVYLVTGGVTPDPPTYVCRTGRVNSGCTEFRDLSAYDVTVSGSTWDVAAPVVTGVSFAPQPAAPAGQVTVGFEVDEAHPVTFFSLSMRNRDPATNNHPFTISSSDGADLADGQFAATVPATAYDGDYVVTFLMVKDSVGNSAYYNPDGTVTLMGGAVTPTRHSLDLAMMKLAVTGSSRDVVPPTLASIASDTATTAVGTGFPVRYAAADDKSTLAQVELVWRRADGALVDSSTPAQPAMVGSFAASLAQPGAFQLQTVKVVDSVGNAMTYRRDGTTFNSASRQAGSHSLDLTRLDVTVLPSRVAGLTATSHPRAVTLRWEVNAVEVADLTGYRVTVQPGNRVVDVPVPSDVVAHPTVSARIDGLDNGRRYTFTVVGRSAVGDGAPASAVGVPMMSDRLFAFGGPGPLFDRSDSNWDGRTDLFAFSSQYDTVYRYLGNGRGGFTGSRQLVEQQVSARVVSGGSLAGGGFPTFLVVDHGTLEVHGTMIDGSVYYRTRLGGGWGTMRFIDGSSDFTGDKFTDVLAVTATGELRLYPGGYGTLGAGRTIGTGWGSMLAVFSPGDLSGDRRPDVVAVDPTGGLWLYRGNGRGGLGSGTKIGSGWAGFGAVFGARDLSGDGRMDLAAVTTTGDLLLYAGRGNGTFASARKIGTGWGAYL